MNQLCHTNWQLAQNLHLSKLLVLLCPCFVRKATAHVERKDLNMRNQSQKVFSGIFIGIPQHQKGYLIYVPSTRKIVSSHDIAFDKTFSSVFGYTSCVYSEAIAMQPEVSYILYATSSHEKTGYIITFEQFEEENLVKTNVT